MTTCRKLKCAEGTRKERARWLCARPRNQWVPLPCRSAAACDPRRNEPTQVSDQAVTQPAWAILFYMSQEAKNSHVSGSPSRSPACQRWGGESHEDKGRGVSWTHPWQMLPCVFCGTSAGSVLPPRRSPAFCDLPGALSPSPNRSEMTHAALYFENNPH